MGRQTCSFFHLCLALLLLVLFYWNPYKPAGIIIHADHILCVCVWQRLNLYYFWYIRSCHLERKFNYFLINLDIVSFFFFWLMVLAGTSSTTLNGNCESELSCRLPHLGGKFFDFSSLNVLLAMGWSFMPSIVLRYIPNLVQVLWRNV